MKIRNQKELLIGLGSAVGVLFFLGLIKFFQIQAAIAQFANMGPPPQAVTTTKVTSMEWEEVITAVGELSPVRGGEFAFQTSGTVERIYFEPGGEVSEGAPLIQLDVSVETGDLEVAKAEKALAETEANRYAKLYQQNATSKSEYDKRLTELKTVEARIHALEGAINRRTLRAPFPGTAGTQQVAIGEYITAGTIVASLVDLSSLYINFTLPEREAFRIKVGDRVRFSTEAAQDESFSAKVSSIDSVVSSTTRNIKVQALLENPKRIFRPGMFVKVEVVLPEKHRYPTIPLTSIQYAPYGNTVYVVQELKGKDEKGYTGVLPKNVRLGPEKGDLVAVVSGLNEGEEVVTSGTFKLFPTAPVVVNNSVTPDASISPNPPNA